MKTNWQVKKLEEVCDLVTRGISPKYILEGGVIVLNQKCIRDHKLNYLEAKRHDDKKNFSKEKFLQIGDILVNSTGVGTLGRVAQVRSINHPTIVDSHITIVRPTKGIFDSSYFGYVMIFIEGIIKEMGTGSSGQTELSRDMLKSIEITYPKTLSEQKRIVKILDEKLGKIKEAIKLREEAIAYTEKILSRTLSEIFEEGKKKGWEERRLDKISDIQMGQSPKGETYNTSGHGVPLINGPVEFGLGPLGKTVASKFTTKPTKLCEAGDLILCVRGSTTGKTNIASSASCIGRGVASIRAKKGNDQSLINISISLQRSYIFSLGTGSTFPNINFNQISNLKISFPDSLTEQKQIVQKLDLLSEKIKQLKELQISQLSDLKRLEKSLLREAFKGEM